MTKLKIFIRLLSISLITFSVLSCGKEKKLPVTFNVRANKKFFVPSTTRSCKDASLGVTTETIAKNYVAFEYPEIEIDRARLEEIYPELDFNTLATNPTKLTFNIVGINVKIDSPNINGGRVRCVIAGEELQYLFYNSTTGLQWTPAALTYDPAYDRNGDSKGDFRGTAYYQANGYTSCPIKCGGIATKDTAFTAPVSFEVIVISSLKNDDGTQSDVPYKITTTGTVQNAF